MPIHLKTPDLAELNPKIAVFGVGGAGGNAVNNMIAAKLQGVSFIVANTDAQALIHSQAETKIQLGAAMTEGLGAGSKPEIGAAAAEESIEEIRAHLRGLHMVFITAGMGGGTGTGAAPVIAQAARAEGVLTVGVVTKPFHFEGQRRMRSAEFGIELLAEQVDTLIVIPNQNLFRVAVMKTTFSEAFAMADQVLHDGISCITDVMVKEGIINLDFADVNLIMRASGAAMMGTGEASGENRGREAAEAAVTNPLLDDVTLQGAKGLLVSIIGGRSDLTLYEVDEAANRVREEVAPDANIIIGTAFDESLEGSVRVSVVATGLGRAAGGAKKPDTAEGANGSKDPGLIRRLDDLQSGSGESSAPVAPAEAIEPESRSDRISIEERAPAIYGAGTPQADTQVNSSALRGGQEPLPAGDSIRMPSIDDFGPVGQVLLREHREEAGIAAQKRRVGFLERLVGLASGSHPKETVAQQPQTNRQIAGHAGEEGGMVIDPHVKGEALSSRTNHRQTGPGKKEDVSEFPSFLRKTN